MSARDAAAGVTVDLVLAALARATETPRYQTGHVRGGPEVEWIWENAGGWRDFDSDSREWSHGGPTDGEVRRALKDAAAEGLAEKRLVKGWPQVWLLTPAGEERVAELDLELPESPSHRAWRLRRARALSQIEPIRERVRLQAKVFAAAAEVEDLHALAVLVDGATIYLSPMSELRSALEQLDAEEPS